MGRDQVPTDRGLIDGGGIAMVEDIQILRSV